MTAPLLEVSDLHKWYDVRAGVIPRVRGHVRAVDGISFALRPREVLGIAGESGSGKSTLAKTLVGVHRPAAGQIRLGGIPLPRRGLGLPSR